MFHPWFEFFSICYHCFWHLMVWCDNLCHTLDVAFVHFWSYINWALLDLIFGMMFVHNMMSSHIKFHSHWMFFYFVLDFLIWLSILCIFVCLCLAWFIWCTYLVNGCWSFWGLLIDCLNLHCVKYWLLFWLLDMVLSLAFTLLLCT